MENETAIKRFVAELVRLTGHPDTHVEKDVWQKLVLEQLYADSDLKKNLIFKGGTCITRTLLGYYRFSEDLDFSWKEQKGKKFYKTFEKTHLKPLSLIGVKPGLHYGTSGGRTMKWDLECGGGKLVLSVNFAQKILFPVEMRKIGSLKIKKKDRKKLEVLYPQIAPAYFAVLEIPCYCAEEIACEKLTAIMTRRELAKPRDLVDLFYLKDMVDLPSLARKKLPLKKMRQHIQAVPKHASIFNERKKDIPAYLERLVEEAQTESALYITPVRPTILKKFTLGTVLPILEKLAKG